MWDVISGRSLKRFDKKFGCQFSNPPQLLGQQHNQASLRLPSCPSLNNLFRRPCWVRKKKFGRWFPIRPRIFRATYISATTNVTANQASTGTIKGASKSSILLSCAYQIFPLMLLLLHALIHEHVQLCKSCCN